MINVILEIFKTILADRSPERICAVRPTSIERNAGFLVDLRNVEVKDLNADD